MEYRKETVADPGDQSGHLPPSSLTVEFGHSLQRRNGCGKLKNILIYPSPSIEPNGSITQPHAPSNRERLSRTYKESKEAKNEGKFSPALAGVLDPSALTSTRRGSTVHCNNVRIYACKKMENGEENLFLFIVSESLSIDVFLLHKFYCNHVFYCPQKFGIQIPASILQATLNCTA